MLKPTSSNSADAGKQRILVIDDDKKLAKLIHDYLTPLGYEVSLVHTGPDGVEQATQQQWAALILDVMLPGMDGFEVLKQIRKTSDVPVLMLTARGDEADRIVGLEIGADDYLPKTFSTRELLARLRAVTRRTSGAGAKKKTDAPEADIVIGKLRVVPGSRVALLNEQPIVLTPVEFDCCFHWLAHAGASNRANNFWKKFATAITTCSTVRLTFIFPVCARSWATTRRHRVISEPFAPRVIC